MSILTPHIKNKYGTIYTPEKVADLILDQALQHYKGDPNTATFCEPAAGNGNILVPIYHRLYDLSPVPDPAQKSLDVLTRLYGVEIMDEPCKAARLRLLKAHALYVPHDLAARTRASKILVRNIIHGNTLRTDGDTWELDSFEGGLTPQWFRALKFDIVVGNPPYTQYKTRTRNLPCPVAHKQTNLGASFWQWSAEHMTDGGVYCLNLATGALNSDSAARRKYAAGLVSVVNNKLTKTYSLGLGGDLPTIVMVGGPYPAPVTLYNGRSADRALLSKGRFLTAAEYPSCGLVTVPVATYSAAGERLFSGNDRPDGHDPSGLPRWDSFVYADGGSDTYIGFGRIICPKPDAHHYFKLCQIDDLSEFSARYRIGAAGYGYTGFLRVDTLEHAKILWCFLNSTYHLSKLLPVYAKPRRGCPKWPTFEINAIDFFLLRVPDLEHYKTARPAQYQAVLDFAEEHIRTGDVKSYCAGVDKVVNDLLDIKHEV